MIVIKANEKRADPTIRSGQERKTTVPNTMVSPERKELVIDEKKGNFTEDINIFGVFSDKKIILIINYFYILRGSSLCDV